MPISLPLFLIRKPRGRKTYWSTQKPPKFDTYVAKNESTRSKTPQLCKRKSIDRTKNQGFAVGAIHDTGTRSSSPSWPPWSTHRGATRGARRTSPGEGNGRPSSSSSAARVRVPAAPPLAAAEASSDVAEGAEKRVRSCGVFEYGKVLRFAFSQWKKGEIFRRLLLVLLKNSFLVTLKCSKIKIVKMY